jgi:hypothetical protein
MRSIKVAHEKPLASEAHHQGRRPAAMVGRLTFGLENAHPSWEFYTMNAVKVDDARRIRLPVLTPGDYYEPEIRREGEEITLRRLPPPRKVWTKAEALKAINKSPLRFTAQWEAVKAETR